MTKIHAFLTRSYAAIVERACRVRGFITVIRLLSPPGLDCYPPSTIHTTPREASSHLGHPACGAWEANPLRLRPCGARSIRVHPWFKDFKIKIRKCVLSIFSSHLFPIPRRALLKQIIFGYASRITHHIFMSISLWHIACLAQIPMKY